MDLEAMAMKGYSAFPKAPALLKPHHQIVLSHITHTRKGSLTSLQRCSRGILQPQPNEPNDFELQHIWSLNVDIGSKYEVYVGLKLVWTTYNCS